MRGVLPGGSGQRLEVAVRMVTHTGAFPVDGPAQAGWGTER